MDDKIIEIKNLKVKYTSDFDVVKAVNGISFSMNKGETIGLVGETGAGKTTTALSMMRLVPDPPGEIYEGEILYKGENLLKFSEKEMRKIRGGSISMIFQDPMTALNPSFAVGDQIMNVIRLHNKISSKDATKKAVDMLKLVGIPPERYNDYPMQFSGGMKQRVVIAMALACNPEILIADEPTTALDVTIQAQVLDLIRELKNKNNTSMLLITHDLGVVAEVCDKVIIMYAGEIVESGDLDEIYNHTAHPYTQGLFGSLPDLESDEEYLKAIDGLMPDPTNLPEGCKFAPRCPHCTDRCKQTDPEIKCISGSHMVRCHLMDNGSGKETENE